MRPKKLDEMVERLDKLFSELPPSDMLVMSMGAIAGSQGYTPLTAMINIGAGSLDLLGDLKAKASRGDAIAGFESGFLMGGILGPIGGLTAGIWSAFDAVDNNSSLPAETKKHLMDAALAKVALACIGAIEAYALTRPGAIAGIGEIVKGIGELVPG